MEESKGTPGFISWLDWIPPGCLLRHVGKVLWRRKSCRCRWRFHRRMLSRLKIQGGLVVVVVVVIIMFPEIKWILQNIPKSCYIKMRSPFRYSYLEYLFWAKYSDQFPPVGHPKLVVKNKGIASQMSQNVAKIQSNLLPNQLEGGNSI